MKNFLLMGLVLIISANIYSQDVNTIATGVERGIINANTTINPPSVPPKISPTIVNAVTYQGDLATMTIVKAEVKDNYYSITYFDAGGALKVYHAPVTSSNPYQLSVPVFVDSTTYDTDGSLPD